MKTTNYDLNIWDKLSHETEGKEYGGWVINVYDLALVNGGLQYDNYLPDLDLELTQEEAEELTLGWGEDLGGDYCEDEDFWLDVEGFFSIYKNIPERVANHLRSFPEYEMRETNTA